MNRCASSSPPNCAMSGCTGGGCPGIGGPPLPRPVPKRPGSKPGTPGGPAERNCVSKESTGVKSLNTCKRTVWIEARAGWHARRQLRWMAGCMAAAWEETWVVWPDEHSATASRRHHGAQRRYERHASGKPVLVAYAAEVARRALGLPAAAHGNGAFSAAYRSRKTIARLQRRARTDHFRRIRLRTRARAHGRDALAQQTQCVAPLPASALAAARSGRARADPRGWNTPRRSRCRACSSCSRRHCRAGL